MGDKKSLEEILEMSKDIYIVQLQARLKLVKDYAKLMKELAEEDD